jgi:selenocysteine lyase/cysteine desulfurase
MRTCPISTTEVPNLHDRLWEEYGIEIPASSRKGGSSVRVSIQGYNRREDVDRLVEALTAILL